MTSLLPPNPLLPLLSVPAPISSAAAPASSHARLSDCHANGPSAAAPHSGDSSTGASAASTTAKLCDEALAATKTLEEEATSLCTINAKRSQQLQAEADLLKSATVAQERICATANALDKERA
jgi:hypothetical protein